jgi:hypothetical protein
MHIRCLTLEGKYIDVNIDENDAIEHLTIEYLKNKIQIEHNIPVDKQVLIYNAWILDNSKKIADCNLENDSIIHLIRLIENRTCNIS